MSPPPQTYIWRGLVLFGLIPWLGAVHAQVVTAPASHSCSCDGSVQYQTSLSAPLQVSLTAADGTVVATLSNASSPVQFYQLCPEAYMLSVVSAAGTDQVVFNIGAGAFHPGAAAEATICSTSGATPLSSFLAGYVSGGQWTGPSGQPDNGTYNAVSEGPGWYVYQVVQGGCAVSTGVLVSEITNSHAGLSTTYLICENYAPFFMTNVLAGQPDPGGTWAYTGGSATDGWYYPATMNTALFTYTVPGVPGCDPVVSTLLVLENQFPDPGENTSIVVCNGAAPFSLLSQLGGTPVSGGTWFNASNQVISDLFDPSVQPPGIYRYHVDGQTPCTDQEAYLTITYTTSNPSGSDGAITLCEGDAPVSLFSHLGGNPVPGGQWLSPQGAPTDGQFDPAADAEGAYQYSYPSVGCIPAYGSVMAQAETAPDAGADQTPELCADGSPVVLSGLLETGIAPTGSWSLNGNPHSGTFPASSPGTFTFVYTLGGGVCPPDQSTVTLTAHTPPPPLPILEEWVCSTEPPIVLTNLYPGISGIVVTDGSGVGIDLFHPAQPPPAPLTATLSSHATCSPSTAELTIHVEFPAFSDTTLSLALCNTLGSYSLDQNGYDLDYSDGQWFENNVPVSPIIGLNTAGTRQFTFVSDPGMACAGGQLQLSVEVVAQSDAGPDGAAVLCMDDDPAALPPFLPDAPPGGSWWINGQPAPELLFDPSSGSSEAWYILPSPSPCLADTAFVELTADPGIDIPAGPDIARCAGSPGESIGPSQTPGYSYFWSPSNLTSDNLQSAQLVVQFPDNWTELYSESLIVSATNGICTRRDTIVVSVYPIPEFIVLGNEPLCAGEILHLEVQGVQYVEWSPSAFFTDPLSPVQDIAPDQSLDASVTGTNSYGCMRSLDVPISVSPLPFISASPPPATACAPFSYTAEWNPLPSGIASAVWQLGEFGEQAGPSATWELASPGLYDLSLVATTQAGCVDSLSWESWVEVFQSAVAAFSFHPDRPTMLNPEVNFRNESQHFDTWTWDFGPLGQSEDLDPVWMFPDESAGSHAVCLQVSNESGCADTSCRVITIGNTTRFYAPNAFTPDADGLNEGFRPVFFGYAVTGYSFEVYDRWGVRVFETNDPEAMWRGNVMNGGYYAPSDVYAWKVKLRTSELADYEEHSGHVVLIR